MKKLGLCIILLISLSAVVFAQKIDTNLIYGSWETQNGTTKGFLTFDPKGAYYYAISDNTKGVDTMLEGTFTFEDDKGLTVLVMNQQKVHKRSGSTNEKATIKYTVVILTEKDLAMGRIGGSGFQEFTRVVYTAAPAKAAPAAVKTPGVPSAEFDLIMGCLENNAERVKYALERGIDYKKIDYWVKWLPEEEKQIIARSSMFWVYENSRRPEYKGFDELDTMKEIEARLIDYSSWVDVISIPIFNQNKTILKLLMNAGFYDDVVFFYENEECVSYSKTLEAFLVDVIIN